MGLDPPAAEQVAAASSLLRRARPEADDAPVTFTLKTDAERWLADERRLIERDEWTPPAARRAQKTTRALTLAEYAQRWIDQRDLKHRTANTYQALADRHIKGSTIGRMPLK